MAPPMRQQMGTLEVKMNLINNICGKSEKGCSVRGARGKEVRKRSSFGKVLGAFLAARRHNAL